MGLCKIYETMLKTKQKWTKEEHNIYIYIINSFSIKISNTFCSVTCSVKVNRQSFPFILLGPMSKMPYFSWVSPCPLSKSLSGTSYKIPVWTLLFSSWREFFLLRQHILCWWQELFYKTKPWDWGTFWHENGGFMKALMMV